MEPPLLNFRFSTVVITGASEPLFWIPRTQTYDLIIKHEVGLFCTEAVCIDSRRGIALIPIGYCSAVYLHSADSGRSDRGAAHPVFRREKIAALMESAGIRLAVVDFFCTMVVPGSLRGSTVSQK